MSEPLESQLTEIGRSVEYPSTPEFDLRNPAQQSRRIRPVLVLAAVAAVVLVVMAFPGPRAAIADLFGIGAVEFRATEVEPSALTGYLPGEEVDLDTAASEVDFDLLTLEETPDVVLLDRTVPGGMVTQGYGQGGGTYRVLITQLHARSEEPALQKLLGDTSVVSQVDVGGTRGFWIEAEHLIVLIDQTGEPIVDSARLSASTLLLVADDVTVRIEGDLTLQQATDMAESLD